MFTYVRRAKIPLTCGMGRREGGTVKCVITVRCFSNTVVCTDMYITDTVLNKQLMFILLWCTMLHKTLHKTLH